MSEGERLRIVELSGTTNALGSLTVTTTINKPGRIVKMVYDHVDAPGSGNWSIQGLNGGVWETVLFSTFAHPAADGSYYVLQSPVDASNSAITNAHANSFLTQTFKFTIANGGNAKTYRWLLYLEEEDKKGFGDER